LLGEMFGLHAANMDFARAYGLLKRIYVDSLGTSQPPINMGLVYLRAMYMGVFAKCAGICLASNGSVGSAFLKRELTRVQMPGYVEAIYLVTSKFTVDEVIYGARDDVDIPVYTTRPEGATFTVSEDGLRSWYIYPVLSKYLVVQVSNEVSESEASILRKVKAYPADLEKWSKLESYVHNTESSTLLSLLSVLAAIEISNGHEIGLSRYDQVIRTVPGFAYSCIQGSDERILHGIDLPAELASKIRSGKDPSSKAVLLRREQVTIEGTQIVDVAHPIYSNRKRLGLIRIGFVWE